MLNVYGTLRSDGRVIDKCNFGETSKFGTNLNEYRNWSKGDRKVDITDDLLDNFKDGSIGRFSYDAVFVLFQLIDTDKNCSELFTAGKTVFSGRGIEDDRVELTVEVK